MRQLQIGLFENSFSRTNRRMNSISVFPHKDGSKYLAIYFQVFAYEEPQMNADRRRCLSAADSSAFIRVHPRSVEAVLPGKNPGKLLAEPGSEGGIYAHPQETHTDYRNCSTDDGSYCRMVSHSPPGQPVECGPLSKVGSCSVIRSPGQSKRTAGSQRRHREPRSPSSPSLLSSAVKNGFRSQNPSESETFQSEILKLMEDN